MGCVDLKASASAALEFMAPIALRIDDPVVKYASEAERAKEEAERAKEEAERANEDGEADADGVEDIPMRRASTISRRTSSNRFQSDGSETKANEKRASLVLKAVIGSMPPKPEIWRIVGAWRASEEPVLSLVPTTSPPGLVSADAAKDVKVWSTCGELWAHFSLRQVDGVPVPATIWPPPHTLASQRALMEIAKGLTMKLGMVTSTKKKKEELLKAGTKGNLDSTNKKVGKQNTGEKLGGGKHDLERRASRMRATSSMPHVNTPEPSATAKKKQTNTDMRMDASVRSSELQDAFDDLGDELAVDQDEEDDEDARSSLDPGSTPAKEARKELNRERMAQMIRQHAFSSGFKTHARFTAFKEMTSKTQPEGRRPVPRGEPTLQELDSKRNEFFTRRASGFGLQLEPLIAEDQDWHVASAGANRTLGSSSSEGALVRFATTAVTGMTSKVRDQLGVDVRTTSRSAIKRHSFVTRLDINNVGPGVTGQAVEKILNSSAPTSALSSGGTRRMSTLQSLNTSGGRKG